MGLFYGWNRPEYCLHRNVEALNRLLLKSRYLVDIDDVNFTTTIFGQSFAVPFGVAPIGFGGVIWPRAAEFLARTALKSNLPFCLSTYATSSLEEIFHIACDHAWFQLYTVNVPEIQEDLIRRARDVGYKTLVVTVDIPTATNRERDIRNGLSVPPALRDWRIALSVIQRPSWALAMLQSGIPEFKNVARYAKSGTSLAELGTFLTSINEGYVTPDALSEIRAAWPGNLIIKGILDPEDARLAVNLGADAVTVSNHGGRQLDAAPTSVESLPAIKDAVADDCLIMVDGGVRSGLDVARMMALGADFVFLGRAFMYGVGALGELGAGHVVSLIKEELRQTMAQIGCPTLTRLPDFLSKSW